jgi:alanine dehydrogenase
MAVGLGAKSRSSTGRLPRLRQLDELFEGRVRTLASTMDIIETEVLGADVVIGAVLVPERARRSSSAATCSST